jgi:hypothetical protein
MGPLTSDRASVAVSERIRNLVSGPGRPARIEVGLGAFRPDRSRATSRQEYD